MYSTKKWVTYLETLFTNLLNPDWVTYLQTTLHEYTQPRLSDLLTNVCSRIYLTKIVWPTYKHWSPIYSTQIEWPTYKHCSWIYQTQIEWPAYRDCSLVIYYTHRHCFKYWLEFEVRFLITEDMFMNLLKSDWVEWRNNFYSDDLNIALLCLGCRWLTVSS